jgi:hypothetical protein
VFKPSTALESRLRQLALRIRRAVAKLPDPAAHSARINLEKARGAVGAGDLPARTLEDLDDVHALDLLEQRDRQLAEAARISLEAPALDAPDALITQPPSARQSLL